MIAPQELRLGNFVNHNSFGVSKIIGILENDLIVEYDGNNYWDDSKYSEPIELNEEWLQKLGFEKKAEHNFRLKVLTRSIIHAYTHGKVEIELGNMSGYSFGYPQVYYVHQLQNLYFALTGKELTLK